MAPTLNVAKHRERAFRDSRVHCDEFLIFGCALPQSLLEVEGNHRRVSGRITKCNDANQWVPNDRELSSWAVIVQRGAEFAALCNFEAPHPQPIRTEQLQMHLVWLSIHQFYSRDSMCPANLISVKHFCLAWIASNHQ